jgi:hypothetical protein
MFVNTPAARSPEKMFDAILPACQIAMRRGASSLVYHEEVIKDTIGRKGPSARPTQNRQTKNDQPEVIVAMQAVTTDQAIMYAGIWYRGRPFAR